MSESEPIRILHLEDKPFHTELVHAALSEEWQDCIVVHVETESSFRLALEIGRIDVILADKVLPTFNGMEALAITRKSFPDVPFIFVSGTMGEETAVEALKSGATDIVLKNNLSRLVPSVYRALRESREHAAHLLTDKKLQTQKMDEVGTIAGAIAHDFNNILTVFTAYCTLIDRKLTENCPVRPYLGKLLDSVDRATTLTRSLLAYNREYSANSPHLVPNVINTKADISISSDEEGHPKIFIRSC